MNIPFVIVDGVPVLAGIEEGHFVGLSVPGGQLAEFEPDEVTGFVSGDPAAVYFGGSMKLVREQGMPIAAAPKKQAGRFKPRGHLFQPLPEGMVSGYPMARPALESFRATVPSEDVVRLSALFAISTIRVRIEAAEASFECFAEFYEKARGRGVFPAIDEIRSCFGQLKNTKARQFSEVSEYAPAIRKAMQEGLRDRALRRHLAMETVLPEGLGLAKLSFTLLLLGQDCMCLDSRILSRMFGSWSKGEQIQTGWPKTDKGHISELGLRRYESVEESFLAGNRFYDPRDPIGRARAQWLSWEPLGHPPAPATHSVWLKVVTKPQLAVVHAPDANENGTNLGGKFAYHVTSVERLSRIQKSGLIPGAMPEHEDRYSEFDDGKHIFFYDDLSRASSWPGYVVLRFPWPADAVQDVNVYGRSLPGQFVSTRGVAPAEIEIGRSNGRWNPIALRASERRGARDSAIPQDAIQARSHARQVLWPTIDVGDPVQYNLGFVPGSDDSWVDATVAMFDRGKEGDDHIYVNFPLGWDTQVESDEWRDRIRAPQEMTADEAGRREGAFRGWEHRRERDEFVQQNLPPELLPLWSRVGSSFHGSPEQRYEDFMQYVHDHPDESLHATQDESSAKVQQLIRQRMASAPVTGGITKDMVEAYTNAQRNRAGQQPYTFIDATRDEGGWVVDVQLAPWLGGGRDIIMPSDKDIRSFLTTGTHDRGANAPNARATEETFTYRGVHWDLITSNGKRHVRIGENTFLLEDQDDPEVRAHTYIDAMLGESVPVPSNLRPAGSQIEEGIVHLMDYLKSGVIPMRPDVKSVRASLDDALKETRNRNWPAASAALYKARNLVNDAKFQSDADVLLVLLGGLIDRDQPPRPLSRPIDSHQLPARPKPPEKVTLQQLAAAFLSDIENPGNTYWKDYMGDMRVPKIVAALKTLKIQDGLGPVLGHGAFGTATVLPDGRILKLTSDPSETQAGYVLQGKKLQHVVEIYGAWFVRGVRVKATVLLGGFGRANKTRQWPMGILIVQRVTPLDRYSTGFEGLTNTVIAYKQEHQLFPSHFVKIGQARARALLKEGSEGLEKVLRDNGQWLRQNDMVDDAYLAEGVADALKETRFYGVYAVDVHGGNVGYVEDSKGDRTYKIYDLGSSSAPAAPHAPTVPEPTGGRGKREPDVGPEQITFPGMEGMLAERQPVPWIGAGVDELEAPRRRRRSA